MNRNILSDNALTRNPVERNLPTGFTPVDAPAAASNRALRGAGQ
jgi:hypothetical protein